MELISFYKQSFGSNKQVFKEILSGLTADQYTWREESGKWNLLEIVCHLHDEEKEDFRARLVSVLTDPLQSFIPIDPVGWVTERKYSEQHFAEVLDKFLSERQYSLNWLDSVSNANWDNTFQHPTIGAMSAKYIIANWLAHDYLHIRQIARIKYKFLKNKSGLLLNYAGDW